MEGQDLGQSQKFIHRGLFAKYWIPVVVFEESLREKVLLAGRPAPGPGKTLSSIQAEHPPSSVRSNYDSQEIASIMEDLGHHTTPWHMRYVG